MPAIVATRDAFSSRDTEPARKEWGNAVDHRVWVGAFRQHACRAPLEYADLDNAFCAGQKARQQFALAWGCLRLRLVEACDDTT